MDSVYRAKGIVCCTNMLSRFSYLPRCICVFPDTMVACGWPLGFMSVPTVIQAPVLHRIPAGGGVVKVVVANVAGVQQA